MHIILNRMNNQSPPQPHLNEHEFALLSSLVREHFGIHITEEKRSMVASRLGKTLKELGLTSFRQYYELLQAEDSKALTELVNRITTNHTFFYRESSHFDFFTKTALPAIVAQQTALRDHDVRVWSAACSSGEEPYLLAMLLREYFGAEYATWNAGVLATDISEHTIGNSHHGHLFSGALARTAARAATKIFPSQTR